MSALKQKKKNEWHKIWDGPRDHGQIVIWYSEANNKLTATELQNYEI